ncbi:MAG: hypothetical protein BroJett021_34690 [Chloroflexota bacterium]|nr:MAG: hypothetical protein BroJett021_34690 [Chloroflexota bacterium]
MDEQRERVYDFPNGFLPQAESMYGWLRHEGFSPNWDSGVRDGEYRYGITLPAGEVPRLRSLQKAYPARWGNHPDVAAALKTGQQQSEQEAEANRQRLGRLSAAQREWIEAIHRETGLYVGQALDLNDQLHELATKHLKLCLIDAGEGLSTEQEAERDAIECWVREICGSVKGIKEAKFLYDPRGSTVAVVFESGTCGIEVSAKERCWASVSRIIERDGAGIQEQIEYEELAGTYGERPDDPVWHEFARTLEGRDGLDSSPRP